MAPITLDLHWMWHILEEIERIRNTVNVIKAVGMDAYKMYTSLLDVTNFNENGLLRHGVINKLYEAKRTLLETRYIGVVNSG